ncbi:MAG: nodulation protein NfeD [Chloroflexi bacterium]|nr:nodulation protein NfeD [Chloroflexota bacterium]
MLRRITRIVLILPLAMGALGVLLLTGGRAQAASPAASPAPEVTVEPGSATVVVLTADGIVDSVLAGYLAEGVARASRDGAAAVVIELNTPGGSLDATQRIVSTLLDAPLPTIVWVTPPGARAASAGTFITMAGHVALMASGTNIGAASPVSGSGEDIEGTLGQKVLNDAIANIRSIAEARGRNADWAEETVRDARSSAASEAVAVGAVDGIADSLEAVFAFAHGRTVTVAGQPQTLALAGATPEDLAMNPFQAFLHLLSDPNVSFILFTIGFYGLLFELQSPNFVTGILGALAIILAFIGFGSLPLNIGGLLLIVLAMVLLGLELTVTSHGLLGAGGVICFGLGASALFTQPGDPFEPLARVAAPVVLTTTVTAGLFLVLVVWAAVRSRGMAAPANLVGSASALSPGVAGVVRRSIEPVGSVYLAGEDWSARSADGRPLERGVPVRVVATDGLTVIVEPDPSSSTQS